MPFPNAFQNVGFALCMLRKSSGFVRHRMMCAEIEYEEVTR
jgi:hypothetical protein